MPDMKFKAPEYRKNGSFKEAVFEFKGSESGGWEILREGHLFLQLGPGYTQVRSLYGGVCATDLARRYLPFPLPQVLGHEIAGWNGDKPVVVEINASHAARGDHPEMCPYCLHDLGSQCPARMTLGIDRLPGGFSPYFLAPVNAIHEVPEAISPRSAVFTEPFAAALKAVEVSSPESGNQLAVLGPRRLGMLIIAALAAYRRRNRIDLEITAILRHGQFADLCRALGTDDVLQTDQRSIEWLQPRFDIVFDTTGRPEGLEYALGLTRRVVHLKSTHGQRVLGLNHLTEMVVEELALLPYDATHLRYKWPTEREPRLNPNIYVSMTVPDAVLNEAREAHREGHFYRMDLQEALAMVKDKAGQLGASPLPRFDLAIVSDLSEVDRVVRPSPGEQVTLVRPGGALLLDRGDDEIKDSVLEQAVHHRKIEIQTSRCGSLKKALAVLKEGPDLLRIMEEKPVTQIYPLSEISTAFQKAADSRESIKVLIKTGQIASDQG